MGWSIYLIEPVTRKVIILPFEHQMFGSTYCLGGTDELWIDVTYNYGYVAYKEKLIKLEYYTQTYMNIKEKLRNFVNLSI